MAESVGSNQPHTFKYGTFVLSASGLKGATDLGDLGLTTLVAVPASNATVAGPFTVGMLALRDAIVAGDRRDEVLRTFVYGFARLRELPTGWEVSEAIGICLRSEFVLAQDLVHPTILVLRQHADFAEGFRAAEEGQQAAVLQLLETGNLIETLAAPLMLLLLKSTIVAGAELELILSAARRFLLRSALAGPLHDRTAKLCASLAAQCFLNEYVYCCDTTERALVESLAARVDARIQAKIHPEAQEVMLLACYASIANYQWPREVVEALAGRTPELASVITQQVDEPRLEAEIEKDIETLGKPANFTSQRVAAMYEENPYPRWTHPIRKPVAPARDTYRRRYPNADFTRLDEVDTPEILVAGCGTGLNIFSAIAGYQRWRVTAIDLSRRSLAYAARRIRSMQVPDVRLVQADILDLKDQARSFDIIECIGVLHHLADPFEGWRVLVDKLRPGGIMQVGLYSKLARRGTDTIRQFASRRGYKPTHDGIAAFRHELLTIIRDKSHPEHRLLNDPTVIGSPDFYSASGCRDLIFHSQETSVSLSDVERWIGKLGLRFLGFSSPGAAWTDAYRAQFPGDPAGTNLGNWTRLENENPMMFARMYMFSVQKPGTR